VKRRQSKVVYKTSLRHVVDLVDLPGKKNIQENRIAEEVQNTHEVVRANITEANAKYKFAADKHRRKKLFQLGDEDVNEGNHSRTSSSKEMGNDENMIQELADEYMDHLERCKSKGTSSRSNVTGTLMGNAGRPIEVTSSRSNVAGQLKENAGRPTVTPLFVKKTLCHNLGVISKHS
nr:transposon Ty3-I Gag-Pol polyprotein [Tanacetum cinerariifolium]